MSGTELFPFKNQAHIQMKLGTILAIAALEIGCPVIAEQFVIKNSTMTVTVDAAKGGAVTSIALDGRKTDLLASPSFIDALWKPGRQSISLAGLAFVVGDKDNGQSLMLETTIGTESDIGRAGFDGLKIEKRFSLDNESDLLDVNYRLTNGSEQPVAICLGTQFHVATQPTDLLSVPSNFGALTYPVPKAGRLPFALGEGRQVYLYDLSESWFGVTPERGSSCVVGFPSSDTSCLKVSVNASAEVLRTQVTIAPGKSYETRAWVTIQKGLQHITSATNAFVAQMSVPRESEGSISVERQEYRDRMSKVAASSLTTIIGSDLGGADALAEEDDIDALVEEDESGGPTQFKGPPIPVRLTLTPTKTQRVKIRWKVRENRSDEWTILKEQSASLKAGELFSLTYPLKLKKKGTHVIRAEIGASQAGNSVAAIEQPVIAGAPNGFYLRPESEKTGSVYDEFKSRLWVPSAEVKRFPLQLAVPLSKGPVRTLFVTPHWTSRGLVEIQHRMDIDVDAVIGGSYYELTGDERARPAEVEAIRRYLNKPHEVIVFAVSAGDYYPADIMDEVYRQVEHEGTGLVFINVVNHVGELDPLLEALKKTASNEEDPDMFPRVRTGRLGKGRIVVNTESLEYVRPKWYGNDEGAMQKLLHTILWAARGEPTVDVSLKDGRRTIGNVDLASRPLTLQVTNEGDTTLKGRLRVSFRRNLLTSYPFYDTGNEFGYRPQVGWEQAAPAFEQPFTVNAGKQIPVNVTCPLLASCTYELDIQILDEDGGVIHWQSFPKTLTNESKIIEATLKTERGENVKVFNFSEAQAREWFRADAVETLHAMCVAKPDSKAVRARLQGFDPWGRMPFDQQVPLKMDGAKATAEFTQPLHSCVHLICVLRFSLLDAEGRELSERRILSFVSTPPSLRPKFELRGYAEVRVANDVAGYDARVGGEGPITLAWHNIRKADYGGFIPMAKEIHPPGYKPLELPDTGELAASAAIGNEKAEDNEDIVDEFEKKEIDPKDGWFRVPCYNNPKDRASIVGGVRNSYEAFSSCYPYAGFAIDEFCYGKEYDPSNTVSFFRRSFIPQRDLNICRCEHCLARFIEYSKNLFNDDLSALNREWGTEYKTWKAVDPPLTAVDNVTPPPPEKWQHILAHRDFITQHVSDLMTEIDQAIRKVHPECRTGFSGLWKNGLTMGVDIYRLSQNMEYNMLYGDIDMWTDFGESQAVRWTGYGRKYRLLQGSVGPYRELLAGQTGVGFYGKWLNPMHRGDFTFISEPKRFFDEVRNIKESGIDRLVVGKRYRDSVALYYSPRDINLAQLEDWFEDPPKFVAGMRNCGRSYMEFCSSEYQTYRALLNRRHLQPFWTAYAHLEEGHFGERFGTPKLLFLPYAQTLSPRQIESLRKYVKEGGVLVGDVNTGRRNQHGRVYEMSALDEVFGIKRTGDYQVRRRTNAANDDGAVTFGNEFGSESFSMKFAAVGPGDIAADTATALARYQLDGKSHPAFLVNNYGKGKAIYLNFIPSGYVAVELGGEGEEKTTTTLEGKAGEYFQRCFDKILELASIKQPMKFIGPGLQSARFGEGDLSYIGVVSSRSLEALRIPYRLEIPEKRHVYSVRAREYLGLHNQFTFKLDETTRRAGDIISLLPYEVERLQVEVAKQVKPGDKLVFSVRVIPEIAQAQRHVIAVRAIDPNGVDVRWYRHSVETENGVAQSYIGLPANAEKGTWKLALTDVASGIGAEAEFIVGPKLSVR